MSPTLAQTTALLDQAWTKVTDDTAEMLADKDKTASLQSVRRMLESGNPLVLPTLPLKVQQAIMSLALLAIAEAANRVALRGEL